MCFLGPQCVGYPWTARADGSNCGEEKMQFGKDMHPFPQMSCQCPKESDINALATCYLVWLFRSLQTMNIMYSI